MNTLEAFARGEANRGKVCRVFDWIRAAELIKERRPAQASAGLSGDWGCTGGDIWGGGAALMGGGTYLRSTWAIPELDLDGEVMECWVWDTPAGNPHGWKSNTLWPPEAMAVLTPRQGETMTTLKEARQRTGISGSKLARVMRVHPQSVVNWEGGRCVPTPARVKRLQELFPGVEFPPHVPPGRKPREARRARILPAFAGRLPVPLRDILTPEAVAPWCAPGKPAEPPDQTPGS